MAFDQQFLHAMDRRSRSLVFDEPLGAGAAALTGGADDDVLVGRSGNDRLFGGGGFDSLRGGSGHDTLDGGTEDDVLAGGSGHDSLVGDGGRDTLKGGSGHDTLDGGTEDDVLAGGSGHDSLIGDGGRDTLGGGSGHDTLDGGTEDDVLAGDSGDDRLIGDDGFDRLTGGAGDDSLDGGAGDDTLAGGTGDDSIDGGTGTDRAVFAGNSTGYRIVTIDGVTTVTDLQRSADGDDGTDTLINVEQLQFADRTITIDREPLVSLDLAMLNGADGFRLDGPTPIAFAGHSVDSAGDVNGDGYDDLIVGAYAYPNNARAGAAYVVFGKEEAFPPSLDLASLDGTNGFRLKGVGSVEDLGISVAGAGDVNGDGYDDLVVGARLADHAGPDSGSAYVVFGTSASFAPVFDPATLDGTNGFRIDGDAAGGRLGHMVSSAGDVNGDGFDDLIVGGDSRGAAYVVFGDSAGFAPTFDLSTLDGANGFRLQPVVGGSHSVSSAGDVNGDGYDDLIVGNVFAGDSGGPTGAAYVVFGHAGGFDPTLDLAALDGTNGFRLNGVAPGDLAGFSVSSAGDINGDGFGDVIVGAFEADPNGTGSGAAYVLFGGAGGFAPALDLSTLDGTAGFRLYGAARYDIAGNSVSRAGDVNGDGFDDLLVGAPGAPSRLPGGPYGSGISYLVYGKAGGFGATLDLSTLDGTNGFSMVGVPGDSSGAVSAAGDLNGDGCDDLIIGAGRSDAGGTDSGAAYVVYGGDFRAETSLLGTAAADSLAGGAAAEIIVGGQGDDTLAGGGGADVFQGGQGDDTVAVPSLDFRLVDGGSGDDTLRLDGAGLTFDLTALANNGITGIETIDLTGSGDNQLALDVLDAYDLSDTTNMLLVKGDAGDQADLQGAWTAASSGGGNGDGTTTVDGELYQLYLGGAATLLIDTDVAVS